MIQLPTGLARPSGRAFLVSLVSVRENLESFRPDAYLTFPGKVTMAVRKTPTLWPDAGLKVGPGPSSRQYPEVEPQPWPETRPWD